MSGYKQSWDYGHICEVNTALAQECSDSGNLSRNMSLSLPFSISVRDKGSSRSAPISLANLLKGLSKLTLAYLSVFVGIYNLNNIRNVQKSSLVDFLIYIFEVNIDR